MTTSPADVLNLHGTEHGLFLGPGIPLIATTLNKAGTACFVPTPQAELESWLGIAYGGAVDLADRMPILEQVTAAYNCGALVQALITAARLRLPPLDQAGLERLACAGLIKANFNPNEPRDGHGRWTIGGDSAPPHDSQAAPPLVFRRPAFSFLGTGSGTAHVELIGNRRPSLEYSARRLGLDRIKLGKIIHDIKDHAGLDPDEDLDFNYDNGDAYYNEENIDNVYNY